MIVFLDDQIGFDGDDFSEARGRRRRPMRKKRRYGMNKAVGYIPAVAAVRYVKDRRDAKDMEARISAKRNRSAKANSRTKMSVEDSVIGRLPKRQSEPKPSRGGSQRQEGKARRPKTTPLPAHLGKKQGVAAAQALAVTQPEQPKSNKMLYAIGGVALLGVIGYLVLRKK
jgi:hypothetical protein